MKKIIAAAVIAMVPFSAMAQGDNPPMHRPSSQTLAYAIDYARNPYQHVDHKYYVYGQSDPVKQQAEITKRRSAFFSIPYVYQVMAMQTAGRTMNSGDCARNPSYMYFTSPNAAMIANRLHADFGCE